MAPKEHYEKKPVAPPRDACECIMMVGLPLSGKTTWVKQHMLANPERNYVVISRDSILKQMKLAQSGAEGAEKRAECEKQADVLFNNYLIKAGKRTRNYILDQPNAYQAARRRRLRFFKGYQRTCKVFCPPEELLASRRGYTPSSTADRDALLSMKANFELPTVSSVECDSVEYVGCTQKEAEAVVATMRATAKAEQVQTHTHTHTHTHSHTYTHTHTHTRTHTHINVYTHTHTHTHTHRKRPASGRQTPLCPLASARRAAAQR
jgi:predicted kinase